MSVLRVLVAAGIAAALSSVPSSSVAGATTGIISFRLHAEPGAAEATTVSLQLDGVDMSASCGAPGTDGFVTCTDLPDGTYDIVLSGVPAGMRTAVNCIDIVAARALRPLIAVGGGYTQWQCTAFVGTPAVVLSVGATTGGPIPDVDLRLASADGLVDDCIADTINGGEPAERCRNLPLGEYTLVVGDAPGTVLSASCAPLIFDESLEFGSPPAPDRAVLTDASWLWWCDLSSLGPTARVELVGDAAHDVTGVRAVVSGEAGPAGDACVISSDVAGLVAYDCFLAPGSYQVTWQSLPGGDAPDQVCSTFEIATDPLAPVICSSAYTGSVGTTVPDDGGVEEPVLEPASTLPSTGSREGRATAVGGLLVVVGAALLVLARLPLRRAD